MEIKMHRLTLYVFWEKDGIVRDYVSYYLSELRKLSDILVIVNGKIRDESKYILEKSGCKLFVRDNHGLDFGAWNDGIKHIGLEKIQELDQLILCNCSCYGPLYPFEEIFQTMGKKNCDFWGLTKHPDNSELLLFRSDENSKLISHIQSFFMVFNNKILKSLRFKQWWSDFIEYNDYMHEVAYHEVKFTKFFEDEGFKSDAYVNNDKYKSKVHKESAMFFAPLDLIREDRIPLIKRKLFIDYTHLFRQSLVRIPNEVLQYIKDNTNYPTDNIWQDLIATQKMSNIKKIFHLNYIIPSQISKPSTRKIALVCYAYYPDTINYLQHYIESMPTNSDIYIISSRVDTLDAYALALEGLNNGEYNFVDTTEQTTNLVRHEYKQSTIFNKIEYRLKLNQGRDVAAYLITAKDIFEKYDYICCIHDKKSPQLSLDVTLDDFNYHCLECCLHSTNYVNNLISCFENNNKLGLLVPPTLYFGPFACFGTPLNANMKWYEKLHTMLNITIPFDDNPMAPFGALFWIRGNATKTLFKFSWKYSEFPNEPLPVDGTISHARERIYPSAVQNEGYYTSYVMPNSFAEIYYNNITEILYSITNNMHKIYGVQNPTNLIDIIKNNYNVSVNNATQLHPIKNKCEKPFKLLKYYKYKYLAYLTLKKIKKFEDRYIMLKKQKNELNVKL